MAHGPDEQYPLETLLDDLLLEEGDVRIHAGNVDGNLNIGGGGQGAERGNNNNIIIIELSSQCRRRIYSNRMQAKKNYNFNFKTFFW